MTARLLVDAVPVSGGTMVGNLLVRGIADTQPRIQLGTDGKVQWGPGNAATDTTLYRNAPGVLKTDGSYRAGNGFVSEQVPSVAVNALASSVISDTQYRLTVGADGKFSWGPGNAVADTTLYRAAADSLKTDDMFTSNGYVNSGTASIDARKYVSAASAAYTVGLAADPTWRFYIGADGKHNWGDGTAVVDVSLVRQGVGTLRVTPGQLQVGGGSDVATFANTGALTINRTAAGSGVLQANVTGDTQNRLAIGADGMHSWGSGALAADTNLYRAAADSLRTDDEFSMVGTAAQRRLGMRVSGDAATYRFQIDTNGKHEWGDGTLAVDTNLYRNAAGSLRTDTALFVGGTLNVVGASAYTSVLTVTRAAASNPALNSRVTGDPADRFMFTLDGRINWGDGTLATDTILYRQAADSLRTDDSFTVGTNLTVVGITSVTGSVNITRAAASNPAIAQQVTGDANPRYQVLIDGTTNWGPGATPTDTNLYRSAASTLKTDGSIMVVGTEVGLLGTATRLKHYGGSSAAIEFLQARVAADVASRYQVFVDGKTQWGDGVNPADANLYRAAADQLQTDDQFNSIRSVNTAAALATGVTGDILRRYVVFADGKTEWGDGTNARDTNLYRNAAGILRSDGLLQAHPAAVGSTAFASIVAAEALSRYVVFGDGKIEWGDGTAARDVNLYRSAANFLKTDDTLIADTLTLGGAGSAFNARAATAAATSRLIANVAGDAQDRFTLFADGKLGWGDGTAVQDTNLQRVGVGFLQTNSRFNVVRTTVSDVVFSFLLSGDPNSRYVMWGDARQEFGNGANLRDVQLARSGAGFLLFSAIGYPGTGTLAIGSPIVTGLASTSGLLAGQLVAGVGVPNGTTILTVDSGTQITMNANATAAGATPLTFSSQAKYIVRASAGQSTLQMVQEWQASDGSIMAAIRQDGYLRGQGIENIGGGGPYINVTATGVLLFNRTAIGNHVLQVVGLAGQTGDLQQWQDSLRNPLLRVQQSGVGPSAKLLWRYGSALHEQDLAAGDATSRMLYQPNGDRFDVLNEAGTLFTASFRTGDSQIYDGVGNVVDTNTPLRVLGKNLGLRMSSFGAGVGVVGLADANTVPSTNPVGGGLLYSEAGALKWRGSAGTVTVLAPA